MANQSVAYVGKRFVIVKSATGIFYVDEYITPTQSAEHAETWQNLDNAIAWCKAQMQHDHFVNGETVKCSDLDYCPTPTNY